jgi:hypothetical protein
MGDISRREVLRRLGAAGLVLGGAAGVAAARWDRGGTASVGAERPQTRDYRIREAPPELPQLVVARAAGAGALVEGAADPAALVRKAVEALGGMRRFISRGDVVVVKPNIGWDPGIARPSTPPTPTPRSSPRWCASPTTPAPRPSS